MHHTRGFGGQETSTNRSLSAFIYEDDSYSHERNINIVGGPADCDWSRWAMVYSKEKEGDLFRVYCFKQGTNDTLYQFGYNDSSEHYEFGYKSTKMLKIKGVPATANTFTFSMLHDGSAYRLYFLDINDRQLLYQFVFNGQDYVVESSNPELRLEGIPTNIDASRMAMLYSKENDSSGYHLYGFEQGRKAHLVQAYYDMNTNSYQRISDVSIEVDSRVSDTSSFSMVNNDNYWCYFLNWIN